MINLALLISLVCNENMFCIEDINRCIESKVRDYVEISEYAEQMSIHAFVDCYQGEFKW